MVERRIAASASECLVIGKRIEELNRTKRAHDKARQIATEVFFMFAEGRGIPGAHFVRVEHDAIIVKVPDENASAG